MDFYWNNLGDLATAAASSEALPSANAQNDHRKRVWRSGNTLTNEWLELTFSSAVATGNCIVIHDFGSDLANAVLQATPTSDWGDMSLETALTSVGDGIALATFTQVAFLKYRVYVPKELSTNVLEVGRMYLGGVTTIGSPKYDGYADQVEDLSRVTLAASGEAYVDVLENRMVQRLAFEALSSTDAGSLVSIQQDRGLGRSFFAQVTEASGAAAYMRYVRFRRLPERSVSAYDGGLVWDVNLELEEQL